MVDVELVRRNISEIINNKVLDHKVVKMLHVLTDKMIRSEEKKEMIKNLQFETLYKHYVDDKILLRGRDINGKLIHLAILDIDQELLSDALIRVYTTVKTGAEFRKLLETVSNHDFDLSI